MPSSNLYSHPDRLLEDHLMGVSSLTELFLAEKPPVIREQISDVCKIIALSHDIGKAIGYFQEYLSADDKIKGQLKNRKETKHSLLSAICTYYLCKDIKPESLYPIFAFLTVRRHHGDMKKVTDDVLVDKDDVEILHRQIKSIDDGSFDILCDELYIAGLSLLLNKEKIFQWVNDFNKESSSLKRTLRKVKEGFSNYIILNLLYSILLDADKSDVVIRDAGIFNRPELNAANWVDYYKSKNIFPPSSINDLRERAYQEVIARDVDLKDKIYSINLPTGLGKTLTSLSFALKLRERTGRNHRIIYALPFLSIIDQNSDVFESVIRLNNIEADNSILLKHHHLSEIFYKKEENEFESDEAKILIEGWNTEIIVTTFVQLFHTLISNRNKSLRKFHRLSDSIIILDEVQSIPIKYWLLIRHVLMELCTSLNSYIILVTATEPLIFGRGEIKSLTNKEVYFRSLDRVSIKPEIDNALTIDELAERFEVNNDRSHLFIFNTIESAKSFYNLVRDKLSSLTYLSTHIIPGERLRRIKEIKEGKYKVVVTTQLVEAGVDIDFDIVVRDMAPLDSINQSAGRCNRNGRNKGEVHIISLKDDRGRKYATYIYDPVLLGITEKILSIHKVIQEQEFLQIIDEYYVETEKKKSQDISREFLDAIKRLRYDSEDNETSISDFKLIEEDYCKNDVFIEIDEGAGQVWKQYIQLKYIDDVFLRKRTFDSMKADFYKYVISIPANVRNTPPMSGEMGYVKQSLLKDYYDNETGFIAKDIKSTVIW